MYAPVNSLPLLEHGWLFRIERHVAHHINIQKWCTNTLDWCLLLWFDSHKYPSTPCLRVLPAFRMHTSDALPCTQRTASVSRRTGQGRRVTTAWVGDSRGVLGRMSPMGKMEAVDLTRDHKPGNPQEKARIISCNGRVEK